MRNIFWRLILALGAGMIVTGLCFNLISQDADMLTYPQHFTRRKLAEIKTLVAEYHQKNGQLPASIADINFDWGATPRQDRRILDSWSHPIIYRHMGQVIASFLTALMAKRAELALIVI